MAKKVSLIPIVRIESVVLVVRGERVILDSDLARLYGVTTTRLNQQVRRNIDRFPEDFAFLLTKKEFANLKLQSARSSSGWGGRRKPPFAFTEHGALMAANVLKTPTAIKASLQVVRTFVKLRQMLASHEQLARKLTALEKKYDRQFKVVFDAVRQLMAPEKTQKNPPIGFR